MNDNTTGAPLPDAEAETQSPPAPAETTAVRVEVSAAPTEENLGANGSGDGGGEAAEDGGENGESEGAVGPEVVMRRKRGRPRKHQLVSPDFSASPAASIGLQRGRGRPRGSSKLQMLASLGELGDAAGGNFTPYTLTIQTGGDIASILSSFAQKGAQSFCILSAVGCVSIVDICPPGCFGSGILRFKFLGFYCFILFSQIFLATEDGFLPFFFIPICFSFSMRGRFELLTLSGSYTCTETGNIERRIGRLSVSLANPDGSVFGGTVIGSLIAAMPIQLILGSFEQNSKLQLLRRHSAEPSMAIGTSSVPNRARIPKPVLKSPNVEEDSVLTPNGNANTISEHNLNDAFLQNSGQNGSQPSDPVSDGKVPT